MISLYGAVVKVHPATFEDMSKDGSILLFAKPPDAPPQRSPW